MGNDNAAIKHLLSLLGIAIDETDYDSQSDAALKLGLLHYKLGEIQKSVSYFQRHFELARRIGKGKMIDSARVNLGIAQANTFIDNYKDIVMNDM